MISVLLALLLACACVGAFARDCYWIGATSADPFVTTNWASPCDSTLPDMNDALIFDGAYPQAANQPYRDYFDLSYVPDGSGGSFQTFTGDENSGGGDAPEPVTLSGVSISGNGGVFVLDAHPSVTVDDVRIQGWTAFPTGALFLCLNTGNGLLNMPITDSDIDAIANGGGGGGRFKVLAGGISIQLPTATHPLLGVYEADPSSLGIAFSGPAARTPVLSGRLIGKIMPYQVTVYNSTVVGDIGVDGESIFDGTAYGPFLFNRVATESTCYFRFVTNTVFHIRNFDTGALPLTGYFYPSTPPFSVTIDRWTMLGAGGSWTMTTVQAGLFFLHELIIGGGIVFDAKAPIKFVDANIVVSGAGSLLKFPHSSPSEFAGNSTITGNALQFDFPFLVTGHLTLASAVAADLTYFGKTMQINSAISSLTIPNVAAPFDCGLAWTYVVPNVVFTVNAPNARFTAASPTVTAGNQMILRNFGTFTSAVLLQSSSRLTLSKIGRNVVAITAAASAGEVVVELAPPLNSGGTVTLNSTVMVNGGAVMNMTCVRGGSEKCECAGAPTVLSGAGATLHVGRDIAFGSPVATSGADQRVIFGDGSAIVPGAALVGAGLFVTDATLTGGITANAMAGSIVLSKFQLSAPLTVLGTSAQSLSFGTLEVMAGASITSAGGVGVSVTGGSGAVIGSGVTFTGPATFTFAAAPQFSGAGGTFTGQSDVVLQSATDLTSVTFATNSKLTVSGGDSIRPTAMNINTLTVLNGGALSFTNAVASTISTLIVEGGGTLRSTAVTAATVNVNTCEFHLSPFVPAVADKISITSATLTRAVAASVGVSTVYLASGAALHSAVALDINYGAGSNGAGRSVLFRSQSNTELIELNPIGDGVTFTGQTNPSLVNLTTCFNAPAINQLTSNVALTIPAGCVNTATACASNPCQNGGSCTAYSQFFRCACVAPFDGWTCGEEHISSSALPLSSSAQLISSSAQLISSSAEKLSSSAERLSSSAERLSSSAERISSSALPLSSSAALIPPISSSAEVASALLSTAVAAPVLSSTAVAPPSNPSSSAVSAGGAASSSAAATPQSPSSSAAPAVEPEQRTGYTRFSLHFSTALSAVTDLAAFRTALIAALAEASGAPASRFEIVWIEAEDADAVSSRGIPVVSAASSGFRAAVDVSPPASASDVSVSSILSAVKTNLPLEVAGVTVNPNARVTCVDSAGAATTCPTSNGGGGGGDDSDDGLSTGAVIGIIVGAAVLFALFVYCACKRASSGPATKPRGGSNMALASAITVQPTAAVTTTAAVPVPTEQLQPTPAVTASPSGSVANSGSVAIEMQPTATATPAAVAATPAPAAAAEAAPAAAAATVYPVPAGAVASGKEFNLPDGYFLKADGTIIDYTGAVRSQWPEFAQFWAQRQAQAAPSPAASV